MVPGKHAVFPKTENLLNYILSIAYKILSAVIYERLKPYISKLKDPGQCGFRPGKSPLDQILETTKEQEIILERFIDDTTYWGDL